MDWFRDLILHFRSDLLLSIDNTSTTQIYVTAYAYLTQIDLSFFS